MVIAGPTAAGKSALALRIATARRGTVINADASQLYADIPILSAAPSPADRDAVPHRLFGTVDGADACSAAAWAAFARAEIDRALDDDRLPIVTGGTGLYLRTLIDGIAPVPSIDPAVRAAVRAMAGDDAYAALRDADPAAAARLAPADRQRVMRALEVVRSTGRRLADWQAAATGGIGAAMDIQGIVVDRPRADLHARMDARFAAMLAAGALAEAARLAARGLDPALPVMKALGVPELLQVVRGSCSLAEATTAALLATRRYAKRQQTWFRNQTPDWKRARDAHVYCYHCVDSATFYL